MPEEWCRLGAIGKRWAVALLLCSVGAPLATGATSSHHPSRDTTPPRVTQWPMVGHDYAETGFSQLRQINAHNVSTLGLAWSFDLQSSRGVEATPVVVNGVMYVTAPWSIVFAIDARSGKELWRFDPEVPRSDAYKGCCDVVNRGVAVYNGRVFVGTLDGRLIALNAANGKELWRQDTVVDHARSYTITGAPRVYDGKVIIGNGGGEYGTRGYVTAYDAMNGKQAWRWYVVPGNPSRPYENEAMAKAAKTWDPSSKYWVTGGGGNVWNAMAFDPHLNLMYFGTGNGSPWAASKRSPKGGMNLYLASIVALNPDTGRFAWYYQETPDDSWDYDATQTLVLADLEIRGRIRKVVMQASKNGYFFVIDRTNGQFISAQHFVAVNWARGYDSAGQPIEVSQTRSATEPFMIVPGPFGGHNWHVMSFSPQLGLAYIPGQIVPTSMVVDKLWTHWGSDEPGEPMSNIGYNMAEDMNPIPPTGTLMGELIAWDPIHQRAAWRHRYSFPWNGGTLATAGNLVFQGTADGRFVAYNARSGKLLWESPVGTGVVAAPATYLLNDKQFVSIAVGWGGTWGQIYRATELNTPGTIYTFALNGHAKMPPFVKYAQGSLVQGVPFDPQDVPQGEKLYMSSCAGCHGWPGFTRGGDVPDLGYVPAGLLMNLEKIVFNGPLKSMGMPDFTGRLTDPQVRQIRAFIQATADEARKQAAH